MQRGQYAVGQSHLQLRRRWAVDLNGGSLAAVTLPSAVNGNTFNVDNGMTEFKGTTPSLVITWV